MANIPPRANQITFYEPNQVDWRKTYPNAYNSSHMIYAPNVHLTSYCQKFVRGQSFKFQLRSNIAPVVTLHNTLTGSEEAVTPIAYNPPNWTGLNVWQYERDCYETGTYYFTAIINEVTMISEPLRVDEFNKGVARAEYSNDENDFDIIFTKDEGETFQTFDFLMDGNFHVNANEREASVYETDKGGISTQDAIAKIKRIANIGSVPSFMVDRITYITCCKVLLINGLYWDVADFDIEHIEGTNMYNVTITFQLSNPEANTIEENPYIITADDIVLTDDPDAGDLIVLTN